MVYTRELMRMTSELGAKVLRVFAAWPGVTLRPEGGGRYDIAQTVWKAEHQDFTAEQTWAWCRQGLEEAARMAGGFRNCAGSTKPSSGDQQRLRRQSADGERSRLRRI